MKKKSQGFTKRKIIDILKNRTVWFVLISICFAGMYAFVSTDNSNFFPLNGDFQNYNPARRFLDGQIPFKDFSVYLGCGQMLLDALGLLVVGNTFTNSLIVMRFFSGIIFFIFVYAISYLISHSHKYSSLLSAALLGLTLIYKFCANRSILEPGNSARLIRCGILAIELALILTAISVIWKKDIIQDKKVIFTSIAIGLITGSGIIWSNDYGVASALCVSFCYAIAVIKIAQKFSTVLINAGVYIVSVLTGFFAAVLIITRGSVGSYFYNTISASSFQKWYYKMDDYNAYRFFDVEVKIVYLFGGILLLYAFFLFLRSKTLEDIFKNSLSCSIFATTLFASHLYHLVSGNSSTLGLSLVVSLYAISYILFNAIQLLRKKELLSKKSNCRFLRKGNLELVALGLCVLLLLTQGGYKIYNNANGDRSSKYLGNDIDGNMSKELADPILKAVEITGEEKIFSTYASAIEVYRGEFQPTGFDYIIHALGDENRQKYLDTFKNGDYKYAITSATRLTDYEYWIKNANWFFYRELCSEYVPTYDNNKWIIWTKSEKDVKTYDVSKAKISIEKINEGSVKLVVESDEKITGTADVSISYDTKFNKSFFKTGNITKTLLLTSITEKNAVNMSGEPVVHVFFNFCVPEQSDGYYIPVTMKDGYGELLLTAMPYDDVELTVNSAELHNIFDFDYIEGNLIKEVM